MVYVGSKARLAKDICVILNHLIKENNIKFYIEPFVGGANIIDKIICENKYGFDIHKGLISIYQHIQNGWIPPLTISEDLYIKARNNEIDEPLRSYIGFNGSYASKYFGGFARGFKDDGITTRDIYNERTRNFLKQIPHLQDIEFGVCSYEFITDIEDCLIYCDPPYENTTKYATDDINYTQFWSWIRKISNTNIVLVSEFNAPNDFITLWEKQRTSSLDKNTGNKSNIEKLFTYSSNKNKIFSEAGLYIE